MDAQCFKVILLGDATVGKTHLASRYVRGTLPAAPKATVGVEFLTKQIELADNVKVRAQIWDTAGQERYKSITATHYRRAVGAIVVYDITKETSFVNTAQWASEMKQSAEPDVVVVLVGNKVDLVEANPSLRQVSQDQAEAFAKKHNYLFFETSAVAGKNVEACFAALMTRIYETRQNVSGGGKQADRQFIDAYISNVKGGLKLNATDHTQKEVRCCGLE